MAQNKRLRQSYEELQESTQSLQREVLSLRQAYGSYSKVLQAVISVLGEETVQHEMDRIAKEQQDAQEAQMAASVKTLVDARVLKPLPATVEGALVVGTDLNASGQTRRVQFELKDTVVPADVLPKFVGIKPGESVENNGVKMTIVEVYEVDKARAAEYQQEQVAAAQAAQAAASAPAEAPSAPAGETSSVPAETPAAE